MVDRTAAPSRRGFLSGAGAVLAGGAVGAVLSACGGSSASAPGATVTHEVPPTGAAAQTDVGVLTAALELERRTVAAYVAGIPLLDAAGAHWAKRFLSEELQHTGELISLIKTAGGTAPPPADSYAIGHPRDGAGVLAVLNVLEALQIAGYLRAIPRLSPGTMRAAAASILADDAQHIAALRQARGRPAMDSAFVTGVV